MGQAVHADVVDDLCTAERFRALLRPLDIRLELWESLLLLRWDRDQVRSEVDRLTLSRRIGRGLEPDEVLLEKLGEFRLECGRLAEGLKRVVNRHPLGIKGKRLDVIIGFIMSAPSAREAASRWIADPAGTAPEVALRLRILRRMAEDYLEALSRVWVPGPEDEYVPEEMPVITPEGLSGSTADPLADLLQSQALLASASPEAADSPSGRDSTSVEVPERRVPAKPSPESPGRKETGTALRILPVALEDLCFALQASRLLAKAYPDVELWELASLIALIRDKAREFISRMAMLKAQGNAERFNRAAATLADRARQMRERHGTLVNGWRQHLESIFGGWSGSAEDRTLALMVATPQGRRRIRLFLRKPGLLEQEARDWAVVFLACVRGDDPDSRSVPASVEAQSARG